LGIKKRIIDTNSESVEKVSKKCIQKSYKPKRVGIVYVVFHRSVLRAIDLNLFALLFQRI
jgi:hypothetical protein